ncbi:SRPBCC family protein [Nocardia blacklockiae]|uniref:SRPBCC family protein n=1 Tax=Nocardia blacklockiae TaxID=480036 RepID=UPI00189627AD|nr:SRPBCC family protein [Nocardia blacklockiae]MBF6176387.1 SRPBCC family protein [Nocardia blacklockiae]
MTPTPTGRLLAAAQGRDLVLTRTYRAPIDDVWASVTEPERTARWFGPWTGDPGPGRNIKVQMAFEEEQPWMDMRIDACDPPHRLGVSAVDEHGAWRLELLLTESEGVTELRFIHHLLTEPEIAQVTHVGPGWEYYLDRLGAARTNAPHPNFADYFPSMSAHYESLLPPTTP